MNKVLICILLPPLLSGCQEDPLMGKCGPLATITERHDTEETDPFTITTLSMDGTCLIIEVTAGGCDGESWTAELLVSTLVAYSDPPQVSIRMILDNDELCRALIRKTLTFDLSSIDEISDRMILHLEGWEQHLNYPAIN